FTSPFSLTDMDKAVKRINEALDKNEKICIYGDYDCDGVTATALLFTFMESLGADVIYFIPNRLTDGYGMNFSAIDKINEQGTDLIITVDNGISSIDEAEYIYSLGMELIVTDHHQLGDVLPKACAVINPHREDNKIKFRDFAGVGVAFKLACAVYDGEVEDMLEQYADLVAIGTIGDIVPLKDENRGLVKTGLNLINMDSRIGIAALKSFAGSSDSDMSAVDVAFQLCPRINAAGRMDTAYKALELLICDDYEEARFKAEQLNDENTHRHEVEENIADDIRLQIENNPSLVKDRVIVIEGKNYHKGVIGIAASHVVEAYSKPSIIIGVDDEGNATASARSIEGFNIYEAINACSDLTTHFGGHPLAAGFGINACDIDEFRKRINEYARDNYPVMPVETLNLDCKISPFYLTTDLVDNLTALEPYGADNSQPLFGLYNMKLKSVTPIGDGKHIRIEAEKKGKSFRIVQFGVRVQDFPYKEGDTLDFAVRISKNLFKGRYYLSIRAVDIHKSSIDEERFFAEKSDYQLFIAGEKNKTAMYPDREACSVVYRFIKQNSGWNYSLDDLYFCLNGITYGQMCFALDAFCEAGLITKNDTITVNQISGKANLENTTVIKALKGRL
ncbi:MAG: single-stranded-DNA-specific exonuclease RecJ, partial [Eubacterium sp.]